MADEKTLGMIAVLDQILDVLRANLVVSKEALDVSKQTLATAKQNLDVSEQALASSLRIEKLLTPKPKPTALQLTYEHSLERGKPKVIHTEYQHTV